MRLRSGARIHYCHAACLCEIFRSPTQRIVYEGRCGWPTYHTYIYKHHSCTVLSSMWGPLRLAPIIVICSWLCRHGCHSETLDKSCHWQLPPVNSFNERPTTSRALNKRLLRHFIVAQRSLLLSNPSFVFRVMAMARGNCFSALLYDKRVVIVIDSRTWYLW